MPNNSSARREKDKKNKDKKKKTDPPPLHKEDKASTNSRTLSLSFAGADKVTPPLEESTLLLEFQRSLTEDEKMDMYEQARKANP